MPSLKPVDSAIFGAGGFAAAGIAAVGSTGNGEQIYRTLLAKYASDCVALGMTAGEAATAAADHFEASFPASMSGVIIIDNEANIGSSHTAPKMAHGWIDRVGDIHTTVRSDP
jgi:isoaspartyl peptidase/L-asparaginase-like protein (Ntn-hydrolase superfamily)